MIDGGLLLIVGGAAMALSSRPAASAVAGIMGPSERIEATLAGLQRAHGADSIPADMAATLERLNHVDL